MVFHEYIQLQWVRMCPVVCCCTSSWVLVVWVSWVLVVVRWYLLFELDSGVLVNWVGRGTCRYTSCCLAYMVGYMLFELGGRATCWGLVMGDFHCYRG